jgi:hypothetical protein
LNSIATSSELADTCHLKGGILMGLLFGSPRLTADIDLTTTAKANEDSVTGFVDALDAGMTFTARELAYPDYVLRVHSVKRLPRHKFPDGGQWPAIKVKINYANRQNRTHMTRFKAGEAVEVVDIDVSFNEPVTHIEVLGLDGENELLSYSRIELIAEKIRALVQQPIRDRYRRQDVYDLSYILTKYSFNEMELVSLRDTIIAKCASREIKVERISLRHPEIAKRAKADWHTLGAEVVELPDFDDSFSVVVGFYEALPW